MPNNNCQFYNNTVYEDGGAIMLYSGVGNTPVYQINSCEIYNNKARLNGSGITIESRPNSTLTYGFNEVVIRKNQLATNGGALANLSVKGSAIIGSIDRANIHSNLSSGSTIYNKSNNYGDIIFNMHNSLITRNIANKVASVIFNDARNQGSCDVLFKT